MEHEVHEKEIKKIPKARFFIIPGIIGLLLMPILSSFAVFILSIGLLVIGIIISATTADIPKSMKVFIFLALVSFVGLIAVMSFNTKSELTDAQGLSRDARRLQTVKSLQTKLEFYFMENQTYPVGQNIVLGKADAVAFSVSDGFTNDFQETYKITENPSPGGVDYTYTSLSNY